MTHKKNLFTSDAKSKYASSVQLSEEDSGVFSGMRVRIRSQQRCPICRSAFRLTSQGLACPRDPHVRPTTFYIDWFYHGENFKLYGFDSFKSAYRKASIIEEEIQTGKFKPQNYKGHAHTATVNKKFSFTERFNGWLELKKRILKPSNPTVNFHKLVNVMAGKMGFSLSE